MLLSPITWARYWRYVEQATLPVLKFPYHNLCFEDATMFWDVVVTMLPTLKLNRGI